MAVKSNVNIMRYTIHYPAGVKILGQENQLKHLSTLHYGTTTAGRLFRFSHPQILCRVLVLLGQLVLRYQLSPARAAGGWPRDPGASAACAWPPQLGSQLPHRRLPRGLLHAPVPELLLPPPGLRLPVRHPLVVLTLHSVTIHQTHLVSTYGVWGVLCLQYFS